MDPNQVLANIRRLVRRYGEAVDAYRDSQGSGPYEDGRAYEDYEDALMEVVQELAPAFEELDDWLSAGGFLPVGWAR